MKSISKNKKGQFASVLLAIITIFIIAIILLFFNRLNNELYDGLDKYFNESTGTNYSEAHDAVMDIRTVENSVWDYAFLAIFIGLIIQIIMFSFATRINIAFFWIMIIIDIPLLIVGVVLSNVWQSVASNTQMVDSIARFPITNAILGTYYPMALTVLFFFVAIMLFGKKPGEA